MYRAVSYNADACCRKLYSSYSSANTPRRAKISLKESHVMIRALQVKIARKEDKKYSLDEKVVPFIGFEEAELVKSMKRSKIDKKIVLEARKKNTKNEEIKRLCSALTKLQNQPDCSYELCTALYDARLMMGSLQRRLKEDEDKDEDIPFN